MVQMSTKNESLFRLRKAYDLNDFALRCGYFWNGSPVNNGYGCMHPEQEERDYGLGKCYAFSCPLAYQQNSEIGDDVVVTYRRTPALHPTLTPGRKVEGECTCDHATSDFRTLRPAWPWDDRDCDSECNVCSDAFRELHEALERGRDDRAYV